ncbi:MAG: AIR synthase-related protein [Thermodesulfobacteriota bacterium]|nr:AIR synthase-related protein [Thermodesulfobacteriota bacterium]
MPAQGDKKTARRVEIALKKGLFDARGERIKKQILAAFGPNTPIASLRYLDIYTLDTTPPDTTPMDTASTATILSEMSLKEAFCDPVIQNIAIDAPLTMDFDWYIEVGYRPGVTDNVGHSARYALGLVTNQDIPVYHSTGYLLKTPLDKTRVNEIAAGCLANELIEFYRILSPADMATLAPYIPRVVDTSVPKTKDISMDLDDKGLMDLSRTRTLVLSLEEMRAIQVYMQRSEIIAERKKAGLDSLTDVELEVLAQTWSEHCKHKIFNAIITYEEKGHTEEISSLFVSYIQGATKKIRKAKGKNDICKSVFTDNAGIIRFNDTHNLVFKVETHNSPSALDPYGGALTGIVGVNRDPFGTGIGAQLIFNTDVFCFASPFYDKELPERILHPRRIFEGVREGVEHGGNKSGIPTINGCLVFDERFLGKPLVYCGTGGIMPSVINGKPSHEKHVEPGDLIVMSGGRIGKDGIHGATFSSEEIHEGSPTSAVQIGDPITQKKLTDFLLKARDKGLYRGITDNGAGGLSSSVGEMAELCGGCRLDLEQPPLKYQGLNPWEILVSEAQERMTLAVEKAHIAAFLALSAEMGVESTVIGEFTDSGVFHCTYEGKTVAWLNLDFMHNGLPRMHLKAVWDRPATPRVDIPDTDNHNELLKKMLGRLNICSKETVIRQYDHEVQGGSVIKPLCGMDLDGPSDAAVIRPLLDSMEGIVVSNGIAPRYSDLDTYHMVACALDEAVRNYVCTGGDPDHCACLDNFCWCDPIKSDTNPDGEYKLAQLVRANKALYDYTVAYGCPLISGKDSMKNDYTNGAIRISIPPTLLVSVIGKIHDISRAMTMDIKDAGDLVYLLGVTKEELGGSEYLALIGLKNGIVPKVEAKTAIERYRNLHTAISRGIIASAHDLSDGGLAVALAEMAFAGGFGMEIDLNQVPAATDKVNADKMNDTGILYSETPSRILVTICPENAGALEDIFGDQAKCIGKTTKHSQLLVKGTKGQTLIDEEIDALKKAWKATLKVS